MTDFSTNKILVEVTVRTQFGAPNAIQLLRTLLDVRAVENVDVRLVRTNYRLHASPAEELYEVGKEGEPLSEPVEEDAAVQLAELGEVFAEGIKAGLEAESDTRGVLKLRRARRGGSMLNIRDELLNGETR